MPGPLPDPNAARRNKPTIPTTNLPAEGRTAPAPACPIELGPDGEAWWRWAWTTPQAAGWSDGDAYFVAHRAALEDDVRAMEAEDFDVAELLGVEPGELSRRVNDVFRRMKSLAAGKVSLTKTMTDMDDRLGLTPKGMANLRWRIVDDEAEEKGRGSTGRPLRVVPPPDGSDPRRLLG